jgi:murein DD-endopeptidase MepM/ murein hydrolase activator NlpD
MAKKYKFNKHTLQYEQVNASFKEKLKTVLYYLAGGIAFATVVMFIGYSLFDSPKEKMQKREIEHLGLQFKMMNDKVAELESIVADMEDRDDNIYRTIFEAEPIPKEKRLAGFGGSDRYAELEGYNNSDQIISTAKRIDKLSRRLYVQSTSFDEIFKMAKNKEKMLASIPGIMPISTKDLRRIASGYGYRIHPVYKKWRMHTGIDFSSPTGTPIYATGDGRVSKPKDGLAGYGKTVVIDHGYGYKSLYAHMSKIAVKPGQRVTRGQIIGYVGNTGISTGPHLHYEVRKNDEPVNPVHFFFQDLSPEEYNQVLEIASRPNQSMS